MWTDDGQTTEASHTKSSPGAFGSGALKSKIFRKEHALWDQSFIDRFGGGGIFRRVKKILLCKGGSLHERGDVFCQLNLISKKGP